MNPRTGLQKTRDVLLCIMAFLVSVVCALLLFFAAAGLDAIRDIQKPTPAITEECVGEIGC